MSRKTLLFIFSLQLFVASYAQPQGDSLVAAAVAADSVFWQAYNRCDVEGMMNLIAPDIEFFHDKGGITIGDSAFRESIKRGLCGNTGYRTRREKMPGSEGIYPMQKDGKTYGVLFTGKHLFYMTENGRKEYATGLAQYADLWLLQNDEWKIGRVFSYDHGPAPYVNSRKTKQVSAVLLKNYAGKYRGPNTGIIVEPSNNSL